jgi:hypothetical protein
MPYPSGINRPDLHLNATATERTAPNVGALEINEEQPDDLNLTNPRNLKGAQFRTYHYGYPPLGPNWPNQIGAFDRLRTRWLEWGIGSISEVASHTGTDRDWSNEPGGVPMPTLETITINGSGTVDSWSGSTTGHTPGTFEVFYSGTQIAVSSQQIIDATNGITVYRFTILDEDGEPFPPEADVSWIEFSVAWSLKNPWTALNVDDRVNVAVANLGPVFAALPDGKLEEYDLTEGNVFTAIAGTRVDILESYKYEARTEITARGESVDVYDATAYWSIPLGGFTLWEIPGGPTELQPGEPDHGPAMISSIPRTLYRGSYDGTNAPTTKLIPLSANDGGGCIIPPAGFDTFTDFRESNLSRVDGDWLCNWRQIRFFEDLPWAWNAVPWYGVAGTPTAGKGVTIRGLWLPWYDLINPQRNTYQEIKIIRVSDSEEIILDICLSQDTPADTSVDYFDQYAATLTMTRESVFTGGRFHLVIETDLGIWDSRDYHIDGLFSLQ